MASVRIQTGVTEPIEALVLDLYGRPLTSKIDIKVKVRRQSDGLYFDWDDNRFRVVPTQLYQVMQEVDPFDFPGEYRLDTAPHSRGFNTAAIDNPNDDDTYEITVDQDGGSDAGNLPQVGEIKVGQYVDQIPDFSSDERTEIKDILGVTGTGTAAYPTSGVLSTIMGLVQSNFFLDETVYNSSGLMTSGRIRIFSTKAAVDAATPGGTNEGELETFQVTSVAEPEPYDSLPATYKVTRE